MEPTESIVSFNIFKGASTGMAYGEINGEKVEIEGNQVFDLSANETLSLWISKNNGAQHSKLILHPLELRTSVFSGACQITKEGRKWQLKVAEGEDGPLIHIGTTVNVSIGDDEIIEG